MFPEYMFVGVPDLGVIPTWTWVKTDGTILGSVNSPPMLEPIFVVGLNRMFLGGTIWLLKSPWPHLPRFLFVREAFWGSRVGCQVVRAPAAGVLGCDLWRVPDGRRRLRAGDGGQVVGVGGRTPGILGVGG